MSKKSAKLHMLNDSHVKKYYEREKWLHEQWSKYLQGHDVKWPGEKAKVKKAQLVGMSFFLGQPVDKDSLGQFVKKVAQGRLDTQVRHLRGYGWSVVGGGRGETHNNHLADGTRMPVNGYALLSVTTPANDYTQSLRLKRSGRLAARDWDELCKFYQNRCAHCGKSVSHPDKGHMDPDKGQDLANLIPLCPDCNNWAQNDVVFDQSGRIITILSERLLKNAPRANLLKIKAWISGHLDRASSE